MNAALAAVCVLAALAMGCDEFFFHRRRGLPLWERVGHPLDTLLVLLCLLQVRFCPFSKASLTGYIVLAIASCLMVTKDEPVHARYCSPGEHWLHSVLFMLHPLLLVGAAAVWPALSAGAPGPSALLSAQCSLTAAFMLYQAVYWNLLWKPFPLVERAR